MRRCGNSQGASGKRIGEPPHPPFSKRESEREIRKSIQANKKDFAVAGPKIDRRARMFLESLKEDRWRRKLIPRVTTERVIRTCFFLGLVEMRLFPAREGRYKWRYLFRITKKGQKALQVGKHPTREEFSQAMHALFPVK